MLVLAGEWNFSMTRTFGQDGVVCDVYKMVDGRPVYHTRGKWFPNGDDADVWGVRHGLLKHYQREVSHVGIVRDRLRCRRRLPG